ncbi:tRNA 2-thiouridine(34) synthase MnmA [Ileibacterium valens]|uniref:tRNA 2-thiouridine(34) synthase MnmA n=1 Tax=Ileibacterium valens TaxID=1862668 RepID=UPI00272CABFF|nr:tRNA 2-thiouridine(34) synthase MnmA [Ileibacterium valens]
MKVLVGLSGGVDSAVAAYLLKEQGFDVTCCFMRNWDSFANNDIKGNPEIFNNTCPQEDDYQDAKKVAEKLGLPLLRVDFIKEYWDQVFTVFLSEYGKGRTPNPDILCNKYIKFDAFYNYALKNGFDLIATGHYASNDYKEKSPQEVRLIFDQTITQTKADSENKTETTGKPTEKEKSVYISLRRAMDQNKDQTYFLAQIPQNALSRTLFPLGHLSKPEVRDLASRLSLDSVKIKKDSTGICFIGERNFREFLSNYLPAKKGQIVDIDTGEILGEHDGVLYYTLGQRKGMNITAHRGPWFVCGKDVESNLLYVCHTDHQDWLYSDLCVVDQINWLIDDIQKVPTDLTVKFRYRQKDIPVQVTIDPDNPTKAMVHYPQLSSSVTAGQEAVFYNGEICLGGGIIETIYRDGQDLTKKINECGIQAYEKAKKQREIRMEKTRKNQKNRARHKKQLKDQKENRKQKDQPDSGNLNKSANQKEQNPNSLPQQEEKSDE